MLYRIKHRLLGPITYSLFNSIITVNYINITSQSALRTVTTLGGVR